jgi:hypothetical protein
MYFNKKLLKERKGVCRELYEHGRGSSKLEWGDRDQRRLYEGQHMPFAEELGR